MEGPRNTLRILLPLCLLLALGLAATAAGAPAAAAPPPSALADAAFLQTLAADGAAAVPAPAGFPPARPATTCTCLQEMNDCRTICTGNGCRPAFVCNTSDPCLSSCRCTHCV